MNKKKTIHSRKMGKMKEQADGPEAYKKLFYLRNANEKFRYAEMHRFDEVWVCLKKKTLPLGL